MPLRIRVGNLNKKRKIDRNAIRKAAVFVLHRSRRNQALIDITFVSNRRIRTLNEKYMGRNAPTDVLSFLLEEKLPQKRKLLVGDIYISSDMAYSNAKRFKTSLARELLLYTIHGVLHLLGFSDKTVKERKKIKKLEDRLLEELWRDKDLLKA